MAAQLNAYLDSATGTRYCLGCVDCDTPALDAADATLTATAAGVCGCCGAVFGGVEADDSDDTLTVYVVRDAAGEYVRDLSDAADAPARTPAGNEAMEFATEDEARDACRRSTDRVLSREVAE